MQTRASTRITYQRGKAFSNKNTKSAEWQNSRFVQTQEIQTEIIYQSPSPPLGANLISGRRRRITVASQKKKSSYRQGQTETNDVPSSTTTVTSKEVLECLWKLKPLHVRKSYREGAGYDCQQLNLAFFRWRRLNVWADAASTPSHFESERIESSGKNIRIILTWEWLVNRICSLKGIYPGRLDALVNRKSCIFLMKSS